MPTSRVLSSLSYDVVGYLDHAHRAALQSRLYRSCVEPGQLEEVIHQTIHPLDGLANLSQGGILIVDHAVLKALRQCPEPGKRGAQVVRHEGHQFTSALLQ